MSLNKFVTDLVVSVFTDPRVKAATIALLGPLVPIAVGAAVKAGMDELIERIPGIDGVIDVVKATDAARHSLNDLIPDIDFGLGPLDELLDFWRPK